MIDRSVVHNSAPFTYKRAKFVARTGAPEPEGKSYFTRADWKTRAVRAETQLSAKPALA